MRIESEAGKPRPPEAPLAVVILERESLANSRPFVITESTGSVGTSVDLIDSIGFGLMSAKNRTPTLDPIVNYRLYTEGAMVRKTAENHSPLKIGDVARQSGVGIETLRFYESRGLIKPTARTEARYRLYDRSIFDRLSFIKKAQSVGFTLDEIARIADEAKHGKRPCAEVRSLAAQRLAELDRKLAELQRYRDELQQTLAAWSREGEKDGLICGLIEGLQPESLHPPRKNALAGPRPARRRS